MLQNYYDKTVIVEKVTLVNSGFGTFTETWSTHLTISCLIDYISGQETQIASQFMDRATHILMADVGYDITIANRINHNGTIYRILHVDEPFSKHAEILLEYVGVDNV